MSKDIFQFGNGAITEPQWKILENYILSNNIKMLVEIGSGYSTVLFSRLPIQIYSFETNKSFIDLVQGQITNPKCRLIHYTYPGFPFLDVTAGMIFVDGPMGSKDHRRSSINFARRNCNKIFIHDASRVGERSNIKSLFNDEWIETKHLGGLSYFEK